MDSSLSYGEPRTCPKCKQKDAIPAGDTRLSCLRCREKANERQRKYRVKGYESVVKKIENERGDRVSTVKTLKRKRKPPTVEYQTADGLYKALRITLRDATSTAAHRMPSFRACFSIVADPSVNDFDRARAVANDLRKIAKYPCANFSRDVTSTTTTTTSSNTPTSITADCRCLAFLNVAGSSSGSSSTSRPSALNSVAKSAAAPAAVTVPLQMASSHHLNSVVPSRTDVAKGNGDGDKLVEALEASFERNCGGKVKISVKSDFSHPLGIPGQKVTVKVVH